MLIYIQNHRSCKDKIYIAYEYDFEKPLRKTYFTCLKYYYSLRFKMSIKFVMFLDSSIFETKARDFFPCVPVSALTVYL